jgi:hypothetical protein
VTDIAQQIAALSVEPSDQTAFGAWLELDDAISFLKENAKQDELVVYASLSHVFIHAVLVPVSRVAEPDVDDLLGWNFNAHASWGVSYRPPNAETARIEGPVAHTGTKTFEDAEKLVFPRSFEGYIGERAYWEVLQPFAHVFELHFVRERSAYCRLDRHGDLEDFIRVVPVGAKGHDGTIVLFRRALVDEWMLLRDSVVVQTFDFTRWKQSGFHGWKHPIERQRTVAGDLAYDKVVQPAYGSFGRGVQIVRPRLEKRQLAFAVGQTDEEQQYASFIAFDFKNGVLRDISCAPGATANYFTKSSLPFETSPAFFRPDVLQRYKADSDKYQIRDRSIQCRGAWYLKTFDINTAGQVHTYICYLRDLPYEEQLHWRAYNEEPKAPISDRALTTDFKGEWHLEYDPLPSLKSALNEMHRERLPWWKFRSEKLLVQVQYPVTSSADEWANELLQMDQLVVEGFDEKWLRKKAHALGRTPDQKFMSLKLVEECLMALGYEEERARAITAPLHMLHFLRSRLKGHASEDDAADIKRRSLSEHRTYTTHFRKLAADCDEAMRAIREAFKDFR